MRYNFNDYIRVKLTDTGREIHRRNHQALQSMMPPDAAEAFPYRAPDEDADGWSKWQGWHLMREFGPWMRMGTEPPFELTVEIVETK